MVGVETVVDARFDEKAHGGYGKLKRGRDMGKEVRLFMRSGAFFTGTVVRWPWWSRWLGLLVDVDGHWCHVSVDVRDVIVVIRNTRVRTDGEDGGSGSANAH